MKSKNTNVEIFVERASSILDISKSRVEELFRPNKLKAFRLNGFRWASLSNEDKHQERKQLIDSLTMVGVDVQAIAWYDDGFSFPAEQTELLTESAPYKSGNIFIQNPSSWLPILLMDFKPGQKILDMCSSPGGKAMHIATIIGELPTMVEVKQHRFNRLVQSLNESGFEIDKNDERLICADGKHLPNLYPDLNCDIVMVDAQCSNEAGINFADRGDPLKGWNEKRVAECVRLQIQLLTAAYKLVNVGGQIIYSTCTLAPEENEAVVSEVVKRIDSKGGMLTPVVNEKYNQGRVDKINTWKGTKFSDEISTAVTRVTPGSDELLDGFCVTKLLKSK